MARRTFFSFHYADVQRASVVRKSPLTQDRDDAGFFDESLWEEAKSKGDENLKALIRTSTVNTSVTCVLNGQFTHQRRWVRYEIVRGVLNGNGLLTVDIHNIRGWDKTVAPEGRNPLDFVGLYRAGDQIYFADWANGGWRKYPDYTLPISGSDLWFSAPASNSVVQLAHYAPRYDYADEDGYDNLGDWIEAAAHAAGR